jgi:UDP-glucose 4-epimerase
VKNIVITGGAGFVGSHLIEELIKDPKVKVYSIDNYSTGSELNHSDGAEYIADSTSNIERYSKLKPETVYHLGEYSRVEKSLDEPFKVLTANLIGTLKVIEFCKEHKAKLVYAGSSTKYDIDSEGINKSPYAFSKNYNTNIITNINNWLGLNFCIAYFYNVYGPREITLGDYATVIGIFKERYRKGQKLPVVMPGNQSRVFTHVNDIVDGLLLIEKYGFGDGYSIGSKDNYKIIEVAEMFGSEIEFIGAQQANRETSTLSNQKLTELGWTATRNLKTYIENIKAGLE